jgi:hypothetical protein
MVCQDGWCIDPCNGINCPPPMVCQDAQCVAPCNCFQGDMGCLPQPGTVCDVGNTNLCVPPICLGVMCLPNQTCDPLTGNCLDFCHPGVKCPKGQKCHEPLGCVELCFDVTCNVGWVCNPETGTCEDASCADVVCIPPAVCVDGACVDMGSGGGGGNGGAAPATVGNGGTGQQLEATRDAGGCGCRLVGQRSSRWSAGWLCALASLAGLGASRRRRFTSESGGRARRPRRFSRGESAAR